MSHGRRRARERVQHTVESILVMLLDRLTTQDTPARVSLFVGRDSRAVALAEAMRNCESLTPADALEATDWPLAVSGGEPAGVLRFSVPTAAPAGAGTTTLAEIAAMLARGEPRVSSLVTGLTHLAPLAEYFRDADKARRRRRAA